MNVKRTWRRPALVIGLATTLALAACTSNPNVTDGGDSGNGDGLTGEIVVSGSSTVEPITSIALEDFTATNPDITYSVDGPGTGDGFALFCEGETDISDASRAINEEEVATCEENGINYVELQIGIDGLSVITSPDNADVSCLSFGDLYALLGPESQDFGNWSDADDLAAEVGADFGEIHAPYPDAQLDDHRAGRGVGHVRQLRRARDRRCRRGTRAG